MANKVLEATINNATKEETQSGYAAAPVDTFGGTTPPSVTSTNSEAMSTTGSARAALILLSLVVASGAWSWATLEGSTQYTAMWISSLVAFGVAIYTCFRPQHARFTAPVYALLQGVVVGTFSKWLNELYPGIVAQAVLATLAIVFVMYTLYSTRVIKVTERFRLIVIGATLGVCLLYLINFVLVLFGASLSIITGSGAFGILFSLAIIAIAASNLALDFDFIERGAQAGLPKYMDWAAAFGLIVTIIWIYLEVLRLLAKIKN